MSVLRYLTGTDNLKTYRLSLIQRHKKKLCAAQPPPGEENNTQLSDPDDSLLTLITPFTAAIKCDLYLCYNQISVCKFVGQLWTKREHLRRSEAKPWLGAFPLLREDSALLDLPELLVRDRLMVGSDYTGASDTMVTVSGEVTVDSHP